MSKFGEIFISANDVDVVIEWRIPNLDLDPLGHCSGFSSPDFSFGGHTWYLHIPYGWSHTYGFCDLLLWKNSSSSSVIQAFSLSLKTVTGEIERERHCSKFFGENYPENYHECLQFLQGSEFYRMRPGDVLTVVCTMKNTTSAGSATEEKDLEQNSENACVKASTQTAEEKCATSTSGFSINPLEQKLSKK